MTLTVPDFHKARVAVAGDVMLDRYWFGPTQRVSPEALVPVVRIDDIEERPGGGAGDLGVRRVLPVAEARQGIGRRSRNGGGRTPEIVHLGRSYRRSTLRRRRADWPSLSLLPLDR